MKTRVIPAVVLSLLASLPSAVRTPQAQQSPRRISIIARRFDYTPGDVTVRKGEPVTLALTSSDAEHGLKFKDLNVVVSAKKGETGQITFTPNQAGTFVGQCSRFCGSGHGTMKMTLHVVE